MGDKPHWRWSPWGGKCLVYAPSSRQITMFEVDEVNSFDLLSWNLFASGSAQEGCSVECCVLHSWQNGWLISVFNSLKISSGKKYVHVCVNRHLSPTEYFFQLLSLYFHVVVRLCFTVNTEKFLVLYLRSVSCMLWKKSQVVKILH